VKRLILVASVAIVALVVAPVASSGAAELTGSCAIKGKAEFKKGGLEAKLSETFQEKLEYKFEGEAKCASTTPPVERKGTVTVSGTFKGTCTGPGESESPEGEGVLQETLPGTEKYNFKLSFVSEKGLVTLKIRKVAGEEPPEALGHANFFASKEQTAKECTEKGAHVLEFNASASGKIG
jgi:hypothetical protein